MPEAGSFAGEAGTMLNRVIMGIGAVCSAVGLGCASFDIGHGLACKASLAEAKDIGTGLLFSIAVAVRGIFALQLRRRP
jgi:hypothetical protein